MKELVSVLRSAGIKDAQMPVAFRPLFMYAAGLVSWLRYPPPCLRHVLNTTHLPKGVPAGSQLTQGIN
jgi:hypothetical protein